MPKQNNPSKKLDKNTLTIIFYLIERLNGVLGKTHLQKLLFLTDLIAIKRFKQPLTSLDYQRYRFGPFSIEIEQYTNFLSKQGLIESRRLPFFNDGTKTYTRYYASKKLSVKPMLLKTLGADKVMLLDEVINSYGNMSLQEVLDIVYNLEIVKGSKINKPLNMAKSIQSEEVEDEVTL